MQSYQVFVVACALALAGTWAEPAAAQREQDSSLRVTARDATGAVIVGATVELSRPSDDAAVAVTSGRGVAELSRLAPGEWTLRVSSPGFDDYVRHDLVLDAGENALDVTLRIAGLVEEITVGRDPQEAAVDPRGDSLTVTLTESELDTLPDTEEELQQLLEELAGPDAEITVDGFLG
jgi:DNA-binding beta-propeller fold protein YncE